MARPARTPCKLRLVTQRNGPRLTTGSQLIGEMNEALDRLTEYDLPKRTDEFPLLLCAGERRSYAANMSSGILPKMKSSNVGTPWHKHVRARLEQVAWGGCDEDQNLR